MSLLLVLAGAFVCVAGGVPGLLLPPGARARRIATAGSVGGSLLGMAGAITALATGRVDSLAYPWPLPGAAFHVALDALSALFLVPLFLVSALAAVSGARSFGDDEHPDDARRTRFFFGLATGAIALVLVARNVFFFLAAWEVMALSAFFLVTADRGSREARDAGRLYLFATHVSTLVLFGFFALFRSLSGSTELVPLPPGVAGTDAGTALFVLALVGFGLKAGLLPLHVWLPPAHAAAPAHVSAFMSGVLIKTGIYGIVRITSLVPDPPASWGDALLVLGAASAVLGVAFALGQHDLKRLLAWHSVENIGIIVLGLGVGLAGRAAGRPEWALLGFAGGLFHVVNHGLFKPLLFLGAGEAVHVAGTRDMDRMGGLGRLLPKTAFFFLAGAVAISGLPPLNGFASEWLVYLGLFDRARATGADALRAAFAAPALALTGALALACFVKAHGAVFLGRTRGDEPHAHGEPRAHVGPMAVLAVACALLGLWPAALAPALARAAAVAAPGPVPATPLADLASLRTVGGLGDRARPPPGGGRPLPAAPARRRAGLRRADVGLRLRAADGPDAVHRVLLRARAGRLLRLGAPPAPEGGPRREALPRHGPLREPRPRHRPRPRRRPGVPRGCLARPQGQDPPAGPDPALPPLRRRDPRRAPLPGLTRGDPMIDTLVHVLLVAPALPPLLPGVIAKTKAAFAGRNGPPLLQAYFDLAKLLRKGQRPARGVGLGLPRGPGRGRRRAPLRVAPPPVRRRTRRPSPSRAT